MSHDDHAQVPIEAYADDEGRFADQEPPAEYFEDFGFEDISTPYFETSTEAPARKTTRNNTMDDLFEVFCRAVAGFHGKPLSEFSSFIERVRTFAFNQTNLSDRDRGKLKRAVESIGFDASADSAGSNLDVSDLPGVTAISLPDIHALVSNIVSLVATGSGATNPSVTWNAFLNGVRRDSYQYWADQHQVLLDQGAPEDEVADAADKMRAYGRNETSAGNEREEFAPSSLDEHLDYEASGGTSLRRIACGLPSLDAELSVKELGKPGYGFIGQGECVLIGGATGTGKTSAGYAMIPGMAYDAMNQGIGPIVTFHTEEESRAKLIGCSIMASDENGIRAGHHEAVRDHVRFYMCGTSRSSIAKYVYEMILKGLDAVGGDGSDPALLQHVPSVIVVDYFQALQDPMDRGDERKAQQNSAEFILRGLQAMDPEEITKFSGVDWTQYSGGTPWPEALVNYRTATVVFAQLNKFNEEQAKYKAGDEDYERFSVPVVSGSGQGHEWVAPDTQTYGWSVEPGDFRVFDKQHITGANQMAQNADAILLLHRSNPYAQPDAEGKHLLDTRARMIVRKARNGVKRGFVPLGFDLTPEGNKARYYDYDAEAALEELSTDMASTMFDLSLYRRTGDPLLPNRGVKDPYGAIPSYTN